MKIRRDRIAVWLTFALGNVGLILLALQPVGSLDFTEFAIIVASAGSFGGVTAEELRGANRRHPPLAYLLNGLVFLYTALAFSFTNDWDPVYEYPVFAFLLGFAVGGIATYITTGPPDE